MDIQTITIKTKTGNATGRFDEKSR